MTRISINDHGPGFFPRVGTQKICCLRSYLTPFNSIFTDCPRVFRTEEFLSILLIFGINIGYSLFQLWLFFNRGRGGGQIPGLCSLLTVNSVELLDSITTGFDGPYTVVRCSSCFWWWHLYSWALLPMFWRSLQFSSSRQSYNLLCLKMVTARISETSTIQPKFT